MQSKAYTQKIKDERADHVMQHQRSWLVQHLHVAEVHLMLIYCKRSPDERDLTLLESQCLRISD